MGKVIIFHGTGANPDVCWYPWLATELTNKGHDVTRPYFPDLNMEPIETFLPKVLAGLDFTPDTILIGHSGGAPLLLSILETIETKVEKAILVAGYLTPPNNAHEPILQETYNWEKIRSNAAELIFINSINDPYGCDDKQGRMLFDQLGGKLIIMDEGHFGSEFKDYPTFEFLNRLI